MSDDLLSYKVSKKASGEWLGLPQSKAGFSEDEVGEVEKTSLLGEGFVLTEYQRGFIIHDSTNTVVMESKVKSLLLLLVQFPLVFGLYHKTKGLELTCQSVKKKTVGSLKLPHHEQKDVIGLVANEKEVVVINKKSLVRVPCNEAGSFEKGQTVPIDSTVSLPAKVSKHVDPMFDGENLLLVHQKTFWLLNTKTGKCIETRELDKTIMLARLVNGKVFGSTINKFFFLTPEGYKELSSTSTISTALPIEGERILLGNVVGLVACYALNGEYLYSLNRQKDEADPMDALIGGGGVYSLFRKGNLIFAGMQDSINIWIFGKRNQRPVRVIDTKNLIAHQITISGNQIQALCMNGGGTSPRKEILCIDIEAQIQALLNLEEPSWEQCKKWRLFLSDASVVTIDSQRQFVQDSFAAVPTRLNNLKIKPQKFMLKKAEDFSGESLVSVDGGFTWTSYDATLSYKTGKWTITLQDLVKVSKTKTVAFCFAYKTGLMTNRQRELKFPVVSVLRIFTQDGQYLDLRSDDTSTNPADFIEQVEKVITPCFTAQDGMSEQFSQFLIQQAQYARRNLKLCEDFFGLTVLSKLSKMKKIHTSKVVIQRSEKYPTVFPEIQKEPFEDLYGEIFSDALIFFRYEKPDGMGAKSQSKKNSSRVQVHMLTVRLSYISEVDTKFIKLSTPHYQYTLWFSNPGIMEEWVRYLRLVYEMKSEDINLPSSNSSTSMYDRPSNEIASYNYSESVEKKMSLVNLSKKKKIKLTPVTTLGRSRDNTIAVLEESVSRFHAKIFVENNVPMLKDLDSAAGTFVNGKKIKIAPLKPGDVIVIGQSAKYEFAIKDSKKIFSMKENPKASA